MSILVVGSVAYDTVETPLGRAERVLGGSASFFSVAASFFSPVNLVGVVGRDFGKPHPRSAATLVAGTAPVAGMPAPYRLSTYSSRILRNSATMESPLRVTSSLPST